MQDTIHYQTIVAHEDRSRRNVDAQQHRRRRDQRHLERWTDPDRLAMNPSNHSGSGRSAQGCQMAIARVLDRMCFALQASGLWLRYATLQIFAILQHWFGDKVH